MKLFSKKVVRFVLLLLLLIISGYGFDAYSYTRTYDVKVGDVIDVYTTPHSNTISVLWNYDISVVRPVTTIYSTTTHVRFEAVAKSTAPGSIIQATTYYTYSGGSGKTFDDYLVVVKENEPDNPPVEEDWSPTITLSSTSIKVGESVTATVWVSPNGYKGEYRWRFTGSGAVEPLGSPTHVGDYYVTYNNSISLSSIRTGNCYICVYLENGQSYTKTLQIIGETDDDIIRNLRFASDMATSECGDIWKTNVYFDEIISSSRTEECFSSNSAVAVVKSCKRIYDSATSKSGRYDLEIQALSPGETTIHFSYGGVQATNYLKVTVDPAWSMLESMASGYENIQRSLGNNNCESYWKISPKICMEGPEFGNICIDSDKGIINATPSLKNGMFIIVTQTKLLQPNSIYTLHIPRHALQKMNGSLNEQNYEIKFITGIGDDTGEGVYMVTSMDDWNLNKPTYFIPETVNKDSKIIYEREILFPLNKIFSFKFIPEKGSWTKGFGNGETNLDLRLGDNNECFYSSIAYESDDADEWKMKCSTDNSKVITKVTLTKLLNTTASWPWTIRFERSVNAGIVKTIANEDGIVERTYFDLFGNKIAIPQKGNFYIVVEGDKRDKIIY